MFRNNLVLIKNGANIHTTCILNGNGQGARAMKKILSGSKKKNIHRPVDTPTLPSTSSTFGKTSFEVKVTGNPRRSSVLNKLFMRHITDLMGTGEYSSQIVGYGIEVNKVQITADYKILKVYWMASQSVDYDSIENILIKNAGLLKHELSELRVMGVVPKIVFVKDKNYSKIAELEKKLSGADFGEDYEATEPGEMYKSDFEIWTSLDNTIKEKLKKLDLESVENLNDTLGEIPAMPQNVLGLNHGDILNRIKKQMTTSEALHRVNPTQESDWSRWSQFKMTQPVNSDPVAFTSQQQQRQAFKEFWYQRQLLKMKQRRTDKNWSPDTELLKEEMRERHVKNLDGNTIFELHENDDHVFDEFVDDM